MTQPDPTELNDDSLLAALEDEEADRLAESALRELAADPIAPPDEYADVCDFADGQGWLDVGLESALPGVAGNPRAPQEDIAGSEIG